jgi:acetyl esterase/lipase
VRILAFLGLAVLCQAQFQRTATLPNWVAVDSNIPYGPYKQTVLDVLRPKAPAAGKRPAVIVTHGGGWIAQVKERMIAGFCLPYLEKGFVVANVEYRLASVAKAPAAVTDVLEAARWFSDHADRYNVDRSRIVVTGESAGGELALMVGMTPESAGLGPVSKIAAVVNIFGVTDVAGQIAGPNARDYAVQWLPEQPGRLELAKRVSPLSYARKGLPAILTVHGDADEVVPYAQAVALHKALKQNGVDSELITVPGGRHGFTARQWDALLPRIFDFLRQRGILR